MKKLVMVLLIHALAGGWSVRAADRDPDPGFFQIQVLEKGTTLPVSLVELRTTHQERFVTDNRGMIAFNLPESMGRETWFTVQGNGYEVAKDGFGYRGVRLVPERGKQARIEVTRTILAQRVGRITGAGLLAESHLCGATVEARETGIVGCDSVQNVVHDGKLYWFWGDTTLAKYPLGIFHGTGATTPIQPKNLEPGTCVELSYFKDGRENPKGIINMPGDGPTWITGLASLPDRQGKRRMVATYAKIKPPMEAYLWGFAEWNEQKAQFDFVREIWRKSSESPKPPLHPQGHTVQWKDPQGRAWLLFGNPLPVMRCPATYEAFFDANQWEELVAPAEVAASTPDGEVKIKPHSGKIGWSAYRKRWVAIFMEAFGKPSAFGELWYAEADSPLGPWTPAIKVLSHENYTFYNPVPHPEFADADTPVLFFEGTYTREFSASKEFTPRYDYNQILYRLDLNDPRLKAAQQASGVAGTASVVRKKL